MSYVNKYIGVEIKEGVGLGIWDLWKVWNISYLTAGHHWAIKIYLPILTIDFILRESFGPGFIKYTGWFWIDIEFGLILDFIKFSVSIPIGKWKYKNKLIDQWFADKVKAVVKAGLARYRKQARDELNEMG